MASLNVGNVGEFLREQRRNAKLSLRQLADAAGVSNPYLSQIERGLRKPSADILQQLAKALRISAETLYVQAGILDERERDDLQVPAAILADPSINEGQKQALLQIYESFRKENGSAQRDGTGADTGAERGAQRGEHHDDGRSGPDAEDAGRAAATAKAAAGGAASAAAGDASAKSTTRAEDAEEDRDDDAEAREADAR